LAEPGLAEPQAAVTAPLPPPLPPRGKTAEELRVEGLIDATFQEYFRGYSIGGRILTVRMPFALNGEREDGRGYSQDFFLDGKGTPARLWPFIDAVLASRGFTGYAEKIGSPGEKVVAFSLPRRSYQVHTSGPLLEALDQDSYPGTPTRIFVPRNGEPLSETDVYNYLPAVGGSSVLNGSLTNPLSSSSGDLGGEVLEVEEPFTKGHKGSSSMPHKKNPVRSERISGLARLVRANAQVGLENVVLWHERDISHSSAERVVFPDALITTDFLLADAADIVRSWVVHPDRMAANLGATRGLIFSQSVLLALTTKGLTREEAYQVVQRNSLKAWNEGLDFRALVTADPDVRRVLGEKDLDRCFSVGPYLDKIDYIFERVFRHES
jgi:hypothetical protein